MNRATLAIGAVALAACFDPAPPTGLPCAPGGGCPPGQDCIDGVCLDPDDGPPTPRCESWRSTLFDPCALPETDGFLTIRGEARLDTDSPLSEALDAEVVVGEIDGVEVLFVVSGSVAIEPGATLLVTGSRPLVLAAWDSLTVAGSVDASGVGTPGPGADGPGCGGAMVEPEDGSGSPGGSGPGGLGGAGGASDEQLPPEPAAPYSSTNRFAGGCSGRSSIDADLRNGGGALVLASRETIELAGGRVSVNGGGGSGGGSDETLTLGGGGGGSGGHAILEAPLMGLADAILVANGGGGGSGGSSAGGEGEPGEPGGDTDIRAPGGRSSDEVGGGGGSGGAGLSCDGAPGEPGIEQADPVGGGGGGGACGRVELLGEPGLTGSTVISPPP